MEVLSHIGTIVTAPWGRRRPTIPSSWCRRPSADGCEAGKRDGAALRAFLDAHAATMPRTALRYAVEQLPAEEKAHYLGLRGH